MAKGIFSDKSMNKMKSPENMNEYIKVANPSVWIFLISILILLSGALVWGFFGKLENKIHVQGIVTNQECVCTVYATELSEIDKGCAVRIGSVSSVVKYVDVENNKVFIDVNIADGSYEVEIIKGLISPISFVTN